MTPITFGITYYKNPDTLAYQLSLWKKFPKEVCDNIEIVIVDDGSPIGKRAEEVVQKEGMPSCKFKLLRVLLDIPWNQCEGRNLIFHMASNEWVFATDADNGVTADVLTPLLNTPLDPKTIYSFQRIEHYSRETLKPHGETRLMTREMFWGRIGPFDEACSGHYAFPERSWVWRVRDSTVNKVELPIALEHIPSYVIYDSETRGLTRKVGRDDAAWQEIIEWKRKNGIGFQCLKHPWKIVMSQ